MAGYGGLGGLGGFAFPTRRGMGEPQSQAVQSDSEFNTEWRNKLLAIPAQVASDGGTELVNGWGGYDAAAAAPFRNEAANSLDASFLGGLDLGGASAAQMGGLGAALSAARQFGVALTPGQQANGAAFGIGTNPYTDAGGAYAAGQGFSHRVMDAGQPSMVSNPAYAQMKGQWDAAAAQRAENQTRQQQAYDGPFMGNGAVGGVMPSNYSSANFGQITGQKQGGLGGLGGADLTSVDQTQQTGAYMGGSGSYNPNPFSAGSFKSQNPWGGF